MLWLVIIIAICFFIEVFLLCSLIVADRQDKQLDEELKNFCRQHEELDTDFNKTLKEIEKELDDTIKEGMKDERNNNK